MSTTPHLGLPLIAAAQAQKHVTHNEALYALDALVHCAVLDKDLSAPPPSPAEGAVYVVGPAPTGDWAGKAGLIVLRQDGAWLPITPKIGFLAYVIDEALLYVFTSSGWSALADALTAIQNLARLGLGTTADATNPFAAKLNKALWTARGTGEGGTGDLRYTLNKQAPANVLSLLFQSGSSGRGEIGLVGTDNLVAKVSPDGTTWREALSLDAATGSLDFLSGEASLASAATVDLGAVRGRRVLVTGTTTITSFGTLANRERLLRFAGALTLTHNATSLALPGGANITTTAGDSAIATSDASGNWRLHGLLRNLVPSAQSLATTATPTFAGAILTAGAETAYAQPLAFSSASGTFAVAGRMGASAAETVFFLDAFVPGNGASKRPILLNPYGGGVTVGSTVAPSGGLDVHGNILPGFDNIWSLGSASRRSTTVYSVTGSINTSDARQKTSVTPMTSAELSAARDIAAEIGTFQWLASIAEKGEAHARHHVGLTVQRAIEIMQAHGLNPYRYAFICHDTYEAEPGRPAEEARDEVLDEAGAVIEPAHPAIEAVPPRPAGDVYSLRSDQLALFIARGQEARLAAMEAALAA